MAKKKEKKPAGKPVAPKAPSKLTPVDVRRASFGSSMMGGFKKGEVQAFLERVAKSMEEILRDKRTLEEQLAELRTKLAAAEQAASEKEKLDEQLFLLTGEIDAYKKEIEQLKQQLENAAGSGTSEELEALKMENQTLRQEYEALRAQMEMMGGAGSGQEAEEVEKLRSELEQLRAKLAEQTGSPAETIAIAKRVAEQIKQKAKEEAKQIIQDAIESMRQALDQL